MKQLTIDTGLREYAVNGGPEHGGGVLRFNPSDPNVYSRFCTLQNQLQELEQQVQAQSPTGTDAIQLLAQADQRAKGLLAEVFGPGNDFDAMLGGTNLLAVAGNGERVITNLFAALQPILEAAGRAAGPGSARRARGAGMSSWRLPTRLEVGGKAYPIHSDYRDILDILHRLNDASEPEFIRWRVALALFYEGDLPHSDYPEAMQKLADFLNCGQTLPRSPAPPLLDWEQDAPLIAADINKVAGCEVRALPYLHWWTFMAWFNSIGDGQLATLLRVRSKLPHGQKLQPWEQDYYRKNKAMVDLRPRLNPAEIAERQRLQRLLAN